ncbi:MAG: hypothetical protein IPK72_25575 [Candidatus Eisenbacteria bacterium]|nr:hypothetical protein [Candidatus Eisenbacteria bacterium]
MRRVFIAPSRLSFCSSVCRAGISAAVVAFATGCGTSPDSSTVPDRLPPAEQGVGPVLLEDFSARQVFPPDNWWNLDISSAPVDANSTDYLQWLGLTNRLHPDFGPPPYGIPYCGVPDTQPLEQVEFIWWPEESDPGAPGYPPGYPIPVQARTQANWIEGGVPGGGTSGDRHLLVIDRVRWLLFETYATRWNSSLNRWEAGNGAVWNLATNDRRPEGWTSADAAGLAIFPGLIRWDEASSGQPIRHALRATVRATNGYVWPASHEAGDTEGALPMGARLRLKSTVPIDGYDPMVQRIFQAMKTYGLIIADNGSDIYITGTMDPNWDNDILNPAFHALHASDFDVVELGWNPVNSGVEER